MFSSKQTIKISKAQPAPTIFSSSAVKPISVPTNSTNTSKEAPSSLTPAHTTPTFGRTCG